MATVKVKIVYVGPVVEFDRRGMEIPRYFAPMNSYVDSPVYVDGYENKDELGDKESYGRSIYATNTDGWGHLPGILPMASFSGRFAEYARAAMVAMKAKIEDTENEGIEFEIEGYQEELYWNQMAPHLVGEGFYTKVGDEEYGTLPEDSGDGGEDGGGDGSGE